MTETITLYIIPPKKQLNAYIDDIDDYLTSYVVSGTSTYTLTCPFNVEEKSILKLPLGRSLQSYKGINYIKIVRNNDDETTITFYYYVENTKMLSNGVLQLNIEMDAIQTLGYILKQNNTLNAKTLIYRQHENRFTKIQQTGSYIYGVNIVDKVSEGLNVNKVRKSTTTLYDIDNNTYKWYLIYQTQEEITGDEHSAVDLFLASDNSICVDAGTSSNKIQLNGGDGLTNFMLVSLKDDTTANTFQIVYYVSTTQYILTLSSNDYDVITFTKTNSATINVKTYNNGSLVNEYSDTHVVRFTSDTEILRIGETQSVYNFSVFENMSKLNITSNKEDAKYILPLGAVSKTNPKLIKIIECPYCPNELTINVGTGAFSVNNFNYEEQVDGGEYTTLKLGLLKSPLSEQELSNTLINTTINNYYTTYYGETWGDLTVSRILSDPKLFHSDFYNDKYVYDNFSYEIPHENLKTTTPTTIDSSLSKVVITFKTTNTINSNMIFKVEPQYKSDSYYLDALDHNGDYDNYIVSTRNNEITIYDNAFVNYLKTGYNYDKKNRALQTIGRWANLGVNVGKSAIMGSIFGSGGQVVAGVGTTLNTLTSQLEADNSFAQKINSLQMQATNVSGSDDVDLLRYYNGNKLLNIQYEPRSDSKKILNDMFYYYGYARNYQDIPNISSRKWFNFLQCKPVWNRTIYGANINNFLFTFLDLLSAKLEEGITFFHANTINNVKTWDIEQVLENWETDL